ncbi:28S rRNA (cytosine-C(5))-methyltransferase-like isoform X2 [Watersipora subatra]|uniref:28S rRNA (cytosine-C(5))-methyltransferase-like isoform X2 n=1 Tax=Watersipora subatra TaxID=2589382 RepID=UPI00355B1ED1
MSLPFLAASILRDINSKKSTVKTAVYSTVYQNKKQLMSVVCECLRHASILREVLELSSFQLCDKRFKKNEELALVVLHQHLFGKGLNGCYSKFKKTVDSQKSAIHSATVRVKLRHKVKSLNEIVSSSSNIPVLPRYIRVNTIVASVSDVLSTFKSSGYEYIDLDNADSQSSSSWVSVDPDISNLLTLPTSIDLHNHNLLLNGSIILQDKASCLSSFVLNPPSGSHVIDACAAPGNKTSHLAAIMSNTGLITAFEKNKKRSKILESMLSKAKVTCSKVINADFTQCDVTKYSDVEYILVDPSCSGSEDNSYSEERLEKLASFQSVILKKALSFPRVKKVVYSTCSVHSKENEQVVRDVLTQMEGRFTLEEALPSWSHRGETLDEEFPLGVNCIRASPQTTKTIGFFLALFTKTSDFS